MCSNHATQANVLKTREKHSCRNIVICRLFANSRNPQQSIVLPSHGSGRLFDPSIDYSKTRESPQKILEHVKVPYRNLLPQRVLKEK